jgi:hypothetical protein
MAIEGVIKISLKPPVAADYSFFVHTASAVGFRFPRAARRLGATELDIG